MLLKLVIPKSTKEESKEDEKKKCKNLIILLSKFITVFAFAINWTHTSSHLQTTNDDKTRGPSLIL